MNTDAAEKTDKRKSLTLDLLLVSLLFAWAFFVNRAMRISGLYMDDLYMWSCYGEQSFTQYVFPLGSTRFRFVYWLFAWLELGFIRNHIGWIVPINILLNALLSSGLYCLCKKLSRSTVVGFLAGILFLSSRFAYYQIGQLLGLMETMGIVFAVLMCWCLYRYINDAKNDRPFYLAVLFYFLNCFTHERYMVLVPMLFYVLLVKKTKDIRKWLVPVFTFASVLLIRFLTIGTLSPAGTGGTDVADTVSAGSVLHNFLTEICYVLGINHGPDYLNGLPWSFTPVLFRVLILAADFVMLVFLLQFLFHEAERKHYGIPGRGLLANGVLFAGFILGTLVSSAVTIRVEMRWVYVTYVFVIMFVSCLYGAGEESRAWREKNMLEKNGFKIADSAPVILCILFAVFMIPAELFYRTKYPSIYLFPDQKRYNSLADETYGKYGSGIFGKEILIIGNSCGMSDFTAETFFKTFDPKRKAEGTTVRHVDSVLDFGQVTEGMLILKEDASNNVFTDVTNMVRSVKLGIVSGYYRDGWMDQNAEINVMSGRDGTIRLHLVYPGNLNGNEEAEILEDDKTPVTVLVKSNVTDYVLTTEPDRIVNLKFSYNFVMRNAQEKRGTDPLSVIVNISTD